MRAAVVGGGLLGVSVAYFLARGGVRVSIVDGQRIGSGTSGATFAWVNARDKAPEGYFALNVAGIEAHRALASALGGTWLRTGGGLAVADESKQAELVERAKRHAELGYAVRLIDGGAVRRLEPRLRVSSTVAAVHYPEEGWLDVGAYLRRLVEEIKDAGGAIIEGAEVVGIDLGPGRAAVSLRGGGRLEADVVVVAAGARSGEVTGWLGTPLPMAPSPGALVTFEPRSSRPGPPIVRRVVHVGDVSLRPSGSRGVLVASRAVDAGLGQQVRELAIDHPIVRELRERAGRWVPALADMDAVDVRIGIRSVAVDGLPVAGPLDDGALIWVLVAHSGVTLAPLLGSLVAAEIRGADRGDTLGSYRPQRFQAMPT